MSLSFEIEGLADLEATMMELKGTINKRIAERALTQSAEPLVERATDLAPMRTGHLKYHITVSKKLSARQRARSRRESDVEVYVGPDPAKQGVQQEFGNRHNRAQPFMRPAWDETKLDVLFNVETDLRSELEKALNRAAKRQARLLAKTGRA